MTYTVFMFHDCKLLAFKTGLKLRHARRYQTQIRDRGPRWEVWIKKETAQ